MLKIKEISLDDITIFGGQTLTFIRGTESEAVVVRHQGNGFDLIERRYSFVPPESIFTTIDNLLKDHDFFALPEEPTRPGMPDEAHPSLALKTAGGREKRVWKWINDEIEDFDPFYDEIIRYLDELMNEYEPNYEGKFQWHGTPRG
ncbi:MAG TPA: hypothetical protein VKK79_07890 [Candidatus Lokiarchaeia archaeon]|nr:hypothetical protein [Candidatus Lokiarchaeia archaeon]